MNPMCRTDAEAKCECNTGIVYLHQNHNPKVANRRIHVLVFIAELPAQGACVQEEM